MATPIIWREERTRLFWSISSGAQAAKEILKKSNMPTQEARSIDRAQVLPSAVAAKTPQPLTPAVSPASIFRTNRHYQRQPAV